MRDGPPSSSTGWRLPEGASCLEPQARARLLEFTRALLEAPTAPYLEFQPLRELLEFAAARPGLEVRIDKHCNLALGWPGRGRRASNAQVLVLSAHLDHPGFRLEGRRGKHLRASFHGGVGARFFRSAAVRFFAPHTGLCTGTARVQSVRTEARPWSVTLALADGAPCAGDLGMWDLTPGRLRGARLHARACDDLLGAAAMLFALDAQQRARARAPLWCWFTRAEETGFVGCLGLLESGEFAAALGGPACVVGLECSPRRATAKVGQGMVLRAGDAGSVFDPRITQHLHALLLELRRRQPHFAFQRALMDGGRCESSAYNYHGLPAAGVCLALGNYHNQGASQRIAPEFVAWRDHETLALFLARLAEGWSGKLEGAQRLGAGTRSAWAQERPRLLASALRLRRALRGVPRQSAE